MPRIIDQHFQAAAAGAELEAVAFSEIGLQLLFRDFAGGNCFCDFPVHHSASAGGRDLPGIDVQAVFVNEHTWLLFLLLEHVFLQRQPAGVCLDCHCCIGFWVVLLYG